MVTLKQKNKFIATILAFAVIPMSGLATDIYLPSMPSMATELHQTESNIQLTLSIFLISYGLTQFLQEVSLILSEDIKFQWPRWLYL